MFWNLTMKDANVICGSHYLLVLVLMLGQHAAGNYYSQKENRKCIPAEDEPTFSSNSLCYALVNFSTPFCQNHGITLDSYVFRQPESQIERNSAGNFGLRLLSNVDPTLVKKELKALNVSFETCFSAVLIYFCRTYFPHCDRTRSVFKEQKPCRDSCHKLLGMCGTAFDVFLRTYVPRLQWRYKEFNCELLPYRNAGESPECWYYNELANTSETSLRSEWNNQADCLQLNGSNYRGSVSITKSGITCQSWTEQCPHRHTMNTTYLELNFAKNYCRNPQNSGKQPWCFTTDRNKRWEYCDIPKCKPDIFDSKMIGVPIGVTVLLTAALLLIFRRYHRKKGFHPYSERSFFSRDLQIPLLPSYLNEFGDGNPLPGHSRGIVLYRRDYVNYRPSRNSRYDRLQLIPRIVIDWLRNAWGNVDEFGRRVYDIMQHNVRQVFVPYDKSALQDDLLKNGLQTSSETFDRFERPKPVQLPSWSENFREVESSEVSSLPPLN